MSLNISSTEGTSVSCDADLADQPLILNYCTLDSEDFISESYKEQVKEIMKLNTDISEDKCNAILDCDSSDLFENDNQEEITKNVLSSISRAENGRLIVPLMWNPQNYEKLSKNYNLSKKLLFNNLKKLRKNPDQLEMVNEVFNQQLEEGIIEKIPNLDKFLISNPNHSFLGHMPVFKFQNETTKCRIVFLSNLSEKNHNTFSHNEGNKSMTVCILLPYIMNVVFLYFNFLPMLSA